MNSINKEHDYEERLTNIGHSIQKTVTIISILVDMDTVPFHATSTYQPLDTDLCNKFKEETRKDVKNSKVLNTILISAHVYCLVLSTLN